VIGFKGSLMLD